ncbi:hypothetical protein Tco_0144122 [Tanacetum coccineum]
MIITNSVVNLIFSVGRVMMKAAAANLLDAKFALMADMDKIQRLSNLHDTVHIFTEVLEARTAKSMFLEDCYFLLLHLVFSGRFFKEAISLEWYNFAYLEDQSLVLEAVQVKLGEQTHQSTASDPQLEGDKNHLALLIPPPDDQHVARWIRAVVIPGRVLVTPGSVITTGSILVTPGSVITTGSILVTPGSVITTGSILVTPGSVITTGSILVTHGSVITTGSILVTPGSVITTGSILVTPGTDIAKIARKRSKPDKHGHGNGKSAQEPEDC